MKTQIRSIVLSSIRISSLNPRKIFNEVKMNELTASVKEKGILQPILVRPTKPTAEHPHAAYEIVCGERRFRAAGVADLQEIPAVIRSLSDKEALEVAVIENLQREDLHPLEEAEGYKNLMEHHRKSPEEIALRVGKSKSYVYGAMKLCDMVPEVAKLFYEDKLNQSVGLLIARMPAEFQIKAAQDIIARDLSFHQAQDHLQREYMLMLKEAGFPVNDADLVPKAGSCTDCPKRTGNQSDLFGEIKSADVCTDPGCFAAKKEAYAARALVSAKESGKEVLSSNKAKQVFGRIGDDAAGYVRLEDVCVEDPQRRKYKQLVKAAKDVKITVAVNPRSNNVVQMITRAEAAKVRKQLEIKKPAEPKQTSGDHLKAKAQEEKEAAVKMVKEVVHQARIQKAQIYMRTVAETFLDNASAGVRMLFMKSRDPEVKVAEVESKIKEHLDTVSPSELPLFCLEMVLLDEIEWGGYGDRGPELCKAYGIDFEQIKKSCQKAPVIPVAEAKVKAERKPAAAAKKTAPAPAAPAKKKVGDLEVLTKEGTLVSFKPKDLLSKEDRKKASEGIKKLGSLFTKAPAAAPAKEEE